MCDGVDIDGLRYQQQGMKYAYAGNSQRSVENGLALPGLMASIYSTERAQRVLIALVMGNG